MIELLVGRSLMYTGGIVTGPSNLSVTEAGLDKLSSFGITYKDRKDVAGVVILRIPVLY